VLWTICYWNNSFGSRSRCENLSHDGCSGAENVKAPGFPPLPELIDQFLENGGKIELCSNSMEFRGIKREDLRDERITIAGAATMVDDALEYDRTMYF
jgi:predicted peroxiredoxin